jgi:hypothetical protein
VKLRLFSLVALLACLPWLGGLLVLGAVVAPTVFNIVPAPTSADAMTVVFRRFDRIAIAASAIVLLCEVGLATVTRTLRDALRSFSAITMSALAIYEGTMLSPKIEALHRAGAIRGLGELGLELEKSHATAELFAKTELAVGIAYVVLLVFTVAGTEVANPVVPSARSARRAQSDAGSDDDSNDGPHRRRKITAG